MGQHEHPQAPAPVFYPAGHPKHKPPTPVPASRVEQPAQQASVHNESQGGAQDLGEVIRGIQDLAHELADAFFAVPDITRSDMTVDPEKFDTSTRYAFVSAGNALDYAIRLVTEKGRSLRIMKLRKELADEMRAAGMTGDPLGVAPGPETPNQVG